MRIGILGTGMVGQTIAARLVGLGHQVMIGTRDVSTLMKKGAASGTAKPFAEWQKENQKVQVGTFAQAAAFAELIMNATKGDGSIPALRAAGEQNLKGKTLIDISNPLDFSKGMPPTLYVKDTDSLGEQIQRTFPDVKVVKTLNTMNCFLMMYPQQLAAGDHTVFMSGNDEQAKAKVMGLLKELGWKDIFDLGDISTARGTEMVLPIWLRAWMKLGNVPFNFKLVR